uniref:RING-type domain-containing protein n=1 Tax=Graphocephala atropunctata TaxID=36148 RepID=A0A1B6LZ08_9HEMI
MCEFVYKSRTLSKCFVKQTPRMEEALGKLSLQELKSCFQSLLKSATCAVCLDVVRSQTVQCINGHVACSTCVANLDSCPTCRQPFSSVQPFYVTQMLNSLPWRRCNHRGCSSILLTDDHAIFCEWKETECELCDWSGPGNELVKHLVSDHPFQKLSQANLYKYYVNEKSTHITPFLLANGHILWVKKVIDPDKTLMMVTFFCVPRGKPERKIFIELHSVTQKDKFSFKIQINSDPDTDTGKENFIAIPNYLLAGCDKKETQVKCVITAYEE